MATVQSYGGVLYDTTLEDLPSWKKDLILRKRANARAYGIVVRAAGGSSSLGVTSTIPQQNYVRSQPGLPQLSIRSGEGTQESECSLNGPQHLMTSRTSAIGSERKGFSSSVQDLEASGDDGRGVRVCDDDINSGGNSAKYNSEMHHKGLFNKSCRVTSALTIKDCKFEEDEEFEYGPGIVSRLKDRYLNLAMRESRARASLRKYSSLEDLLDEAPAWPERGRSAVKVRTAAGTPPVRHEIMKRTRSMDSLSLRRMDSLENKIPKSQSSGGIRQAQFPALSKDVIIIEAPIVDKKKEVTKSVKGESEILSRKVSSSQLEDVEMPPPYTVKQTKQIFESAPVIKSIRGTAAKVAAYKASQAAKKGTKPNTVKPVIKAKPIQLLQSKKFHNSSVEEARSSLKQVPVVGRPVPRSTLSIKAVPLTNGSIHPNSPSPTLLSGLTPVSASVTAPLVNGDHKLDAEGDADEVGIKKVSQTAISNIRKESSSQDFDFTDDTRISPVQRSSRISRPLSPIPANLPHSPTLSPKVNIPQAFKEECDNTKENQRVQLENKKNVEKSKPFKELHSNAKKELSPSVGGVLSSDSQGDKTVVPSPSIIDKIKSNVNFAQNTDSPVPTGPGKAIQESSPLISSPEIKEEYVIKTDISARVLNSDPKPSSFAPQSTSTPVVNLKPTKSKERWHQQENNTLVFNFAKRADTPDYIENDGVDLSKRQHMHETSGYVIMPGYDGRLDSSTDGDDPEDDSYDGKLPVSPLPPTPCNIAFVGEGVIINGRSNLQRQPRNKKLEISFDMASTKIFEYPSEDSLLDDSERARKSESSSNTLSNLSSGGFASYTPTKLLLSDSFELGISRATSVHPPTPPRERPAYEEEDLLLHQHIRPASEAEIITWSSESVPDLLF